MTDTTHGQLHEVKGGGGRKFITFLWSTVFLVLVAAAFVGTRIFVADADTLGYGVPHQAALYVHGPAGTDVGTFGLPQSPRSIAADEWAIFAISGKDGGASWGTLLGWKPLRRPTPEEIAELGLLGAEAVNERTYVLGSEEAKSASHQAVAARSSLYNDPTLRSALRTMAGIASVQGYAEPALPALLRLSLTTVEAFSASEPVVFALDSDDRVTYAAILPVVTAASYPPILGFAPPAETTGAARPLALTEADVTVSSPTAVIDPLNALFWPVEKARLEQQTPPTEEYLAAAGELRQMLRGPISVSLIMDKETGETRYVADFPRTSPTQVKKTVLAYLGASLPERTKVYLPDTDVSYELNLNPDKYAFSSSSEVGVETVQDDDSGFSLVVAPDGKDGTYLSTKPGFIKTILQDGPMKGNGRCSEPNGSSTLHINMPLFGFNKLSLISDGDKLIRACGYHQ